MDIRDVCLQYKGNLQLCCTSCTESLSSYTPQEATPRVVGRAPARPAACSWLMAGCESLGARITVWVAGARAARRLQPMPLGLQPMAGTLAANRVPRLPCCSPAHRPAQNCAVRPGIY